MSHHVFEPASPVVARYIKIEPPPNTEIGFIYVQYADDRGNMVQALFPPIPGGLENNIGKIVTHWALLELVTAQLIQALLRASGHPDPKAREFKRKLEVAKTEFKAAFKDHPELLAYWQREILGRINRTKTVRNLLNHAQMFGQDSPKGPYVGFVTDRLGKKARRRFFEADFIKIQTEISEAAGLINMLATAPDDVPIPSPDKLALRRVLDKDRWNQAIDRALELQPQPSRQKSQRPSKPKRR